MPNHEPVRANQDAASVVHGKLTFAKNGIIAGENAGIARFTDSQCGITLDIKSPFFPQMSNRTEMLVDKKTYEAVAGERQTGESGNNQFWKPAERFDIDDLMAEMEAGK